MRRIKKAEKIRKSEKEVKNMDEELPKGAATRIIEELRTKGWTDTEIVDFLLKIWKN